MNVNSNPPTAKIYQFPRTTSADLGRSGRGRAPAAESRPRALPAVEFGSGWYHEAAVEAERPRKP